MSARAQLETAVESGRHRASRPTAQRIYAEAERMIQSSEYDSEVVRAALQEISQRALREGDSIKRDAVAEVIDAFEGRCDADSALPA